MLSGKTSREYMAGAQAEVYVEGHETRGMPHAYKRGARQVVSLREMHPDFDDLVARAGATSAATVRFYDLVGVCADEPCINCMFIAFCGEKAMTCPAFRSYISASGGRHTARIKVPDKSLYEEDNDADDF